MWLNLLDFDKKKKKDRKKYTWNKHDVFETDSRRSEKNTRFIIHAAKSRFTPGAQWSRNLQRLSNRLIYQSIVDERMKIRIKYDLRRVGNIKRTRVSGVHWNTNASGYVIRADSPGTHRVHIRPRDEHARPGPKIEPRLAGSTVDQRIHEPEDRAKRNTKISLANKFQILYLSLAQVEST